MHGAYFPGRVMGSNYVLSICHYTSDVCACLHSALDLLCRWSCVAMVCVLSKALEHMTPSLVHVLTENSF